MEKYYNQPSGTIAQIVTYKRNPSKKLIRSMLKKDISAEWWYNDSEPIFRDIENSEDNESSTPFGSTLKDLVDSNKCLIKTNARIVNKLLNYLEEKESKEEE